MKAKKTKLALWICAIVVLLVASILVPSVQKTETIQVTMRDAVLHETNRISLFGIKDVNPALISAMVVSGILLVFAVIVRIFVIPRFKMVPGKFQMLLEQAVDLFDGMAKSNSPGRSGFLGAYIFTAGAYIFIGTLFELFGIQAITTEGSPITLPAPLSDVNAAIAMGCFSYLVILGGGIAYNGFKGVGSTLKEFSLPISMSFRYGACVLLCESELCAAGHRGRYVHAAARAHSGICFDDARRALFRRGFREAGTEKEKSKSRS